MAAQITIEPGQLEVTNSLERRYNRETGLCTQSASYRNTSGTLSETCKSVAITLAWILVCNNGLTTRKLDM